MSVVFDSDILTFHEVGNMIKHYSGVLKSPLLFENTTRSLLFRCNRFLKFNPPNGIDGSWSYSDRADSIEFTSTSQSCYTVFSILAQTVAIILFLPKLKLQPTILASERNQEHTLQKRKRLINYYGFDVMFDPPIRLEAHESYRLVSLIKGPSSWYGGEGVTSLKLRGVQVNFMKSMESDNHTSETRGQFPAFIFSTC